MWTTEFWRAAVERAIRTIAQTAVALLISAGTGLLDTSWLPVLSIAGMAGLLSLLTSIGANGVGPAGPSLAGETVIPGELVDGDGA